MKRRWVIIGVLIVVTIILLFVNKTQASQLTPTDPGTCTPTPTKTPSPICLQEGDEDVQVPCTTPTLTPTPIAGESATPTPTQSPSVLSNSSQQPPQPVCNTPFDKPTIVSFTAKGNGIVNFAWVENQGSIDKYSIIYGYSPNSLIYGEDNIPSTAWNIDIGSLKPGNSVYAQVWAWMGRCAEMSNIFDPHVL